MMKYPFAVYKPPILSNSFRINVFSEHNKAFKAVPYVTALGRSTPKASEPHKKDVTSWSVPNAIKYERCLVYDCTQHIGKAYCTS